MKDELYTIEDVAKATKMTVSTIRDWVWKNRIETIRCGRSVRITEEEFQRIMRGEKPIAVKKGANK